MPSFVFQNVLAMAGGVIDRVKVVFLSSWFVMQNLVTVSHNVCIHVGGPQKLGDLAPCPL